LRKSPNPIDVHVGSRVRLRRMLIGMSQEKLGDQLRLTFQQVQKYEKGSNRIGASRLFQISQILGVPVQFFYDDLDSGAGAAVAGFAEAQPQDNVMDFVSTAEGVTLNRAYARISDPQLRRRVLDLVRALAGEGESAAEDKAEQRRS
jgi:transcriptional regulator with XRE-family HTH domain